MLRYSQKTIFGCHLEFANVQFLECDISHKLKLRLHTVKYIITCQHSVHAARDIITEIPSICLFITITQLLYLNECTYHQTLFTV